MSERVGSVSRDFYSTHSAMMSFIFFSLIPISPIFPTATLVQALKIIIM